MPNTAGTWDLPAINYRNPNMGSSNINSNSMPVFNNSSMLNTPLGRVYSSPAPPVPARPVRNTYNNGYNSYSSPFNGYGGYSPGFGSYGYYGGYRPSFNSFGYGSGYYSNAYPESRFIQLAEESSRPAFQTIQSILQAFSSVTMMFESSFHAIYSSYMSVIGVADNFGKLRNAFGQIFSTFAVIRSLNWLFRKLMYMLGINRENYKKEFIWSEALNEVSDVQGDNKMHKKRMWPVLLFMSILIGGPYILFKLMSELYPNPVPEIWKPIEQPGSLAVALYDFHAASDQELSFSAQQKLMIAPKKYQPLDCPGWLLACNENRKTGLVPNNYVGIIMQSEKTGQTYIEHNGHTYQHPGESSNFDNFQKAKSHQSDSKNTENEKLEKIIEEVNEVSDN